MDMNYILLENVSKSLKGRDVIKNVNLKLERGKTYAFLGRNASGKTMLFRIISGLILPTSGTVEVFGQKVSEKQIFPKNMGVVIEAVGLWKHLTGYENLKLISEIRCVASKNDIRTALSRVGLDPDDKRKYSAFSMGMRQKLAIAQAIMEKPELLILDEPSNGLDEDSISFFQSLIREEQARGVTCLIATHQVEDIKGLYHEAYRMKDGLCTSAQGEIAI
jgi:ABC-2 type transport system ATP-binding protein